MAKKYLITSALPYVNYNLHIGHLVGCLLPSDVYARFCRARGRDVLFVCGADEHGTASEIGAMKERMPVEKYVDKYRAAHEDAVKKFNLSFDICNVFRRRFCRVYAHFNRIVLRRKSKCVPSHGMNQVISLHHLISAPYIRNNVASPMTYMQTTA